jgi:hypothetical protein
MDNLTVALLRRESQTGTSGWQLRLIESKR